MKLYYFMIIAIGLMYTFSLAGVDTVTNSVLDRIGLMPDNLNSTVVDYDVNDYSGNSAENIYQTDSWWESIKIAMAVLIFLGVASGIQIFGSGINLSNVVTTAMAGLSLVLFSMFVVDFVSVLRKIYIVTGGVGWEFNIAWVIIVPFILTFAFSLIKFIQGTE